MLISFEGIDGCGKTTQINLLRARLEKEKIPVEVMREPGGTELSEMIRGMLLNPEIEMHPVTEMLLFSAARSELVSSKVQPLLSQNVVVILDRFFDSTTAYQGYGRESASIPEIERLNGLASHHTEPDLTFYLDIDVESAHQRRKGQAEDRMEQSGREFYERVRNGFRKLATEKIRFRMIDAAQTPEQIHAQIWQQVSAHLA